MRAFVSLLLVVSGMSTNALAQSATGNMSRKVIPPGQNDLVKKMLTVPNCATGDIQIDRDSITTRLTCGKNDVSHAVKLHHADLKIADTTLSTQKFSVVINPAPKSVAEKLAAQIRTHEGPFRWVIESQGVPPANKAPILPQAPKGDRRDGPQYDQYQKGFKLFLAKKHVAAFDYFLAMARESPKYSGVLGMLVANLAPQQPDRARVQQFMDAADAASGDTLKQFLAGVAAHYSAHYKAQTRDAKKALYEISIRYLSRTRPAYNFEPRVYIYLAVSHFRLGDQARAEFLIEEAVALNRKDPDAYYCRAEIFHRSQPQKAIADIDTYLDLTESTSVADSKFQRVRNMKAYLLRVERGESELVDLWDPISGRTYEVPEGADVFQDPTRGTWVFILMLIAVIGLSQLIFRRRSSE
jgi:tetratricopeptide (TPR) repeat protein